MSRSWKIPTNLFPESSRCNVIIGLSSVICYGNRRFRVAPHVSKRVQVRSLSYGNFIHTQILVHLDLLWNRGERQLAYSKEFSIFGLWAWRKRFYYYYFYYYYYFIFRHNTTDDRLHKIGPLVFLWNFSDGLMSTVFAPTPLHPVTPVYVTLFHCNSKHVTTDVNIHKLTNHIHLRLLFVVSTFVACCLLYVCAIVAKSRTEFYFVHRCAQRKCLHAYIFVASFVTCMNKVILTALNLNLTKNKSIY